MIFESWFSNLLITLATLILIFVIWVKQKQNYWKSRGIITPPVVFFVGTLSKSLNQGASAADMICSDYRLFKTKKLKHGGSYALCSPIYMPVDPNIIKSIMQNDFHHFVDRGIYYNEKDDPLSAHLFSIEGKKWKNLRTKLTPTFTSGKMKMMLGTIVECGEELIKTMETMTSEPIDIKDILGRFTTDVIGSCAFGIKCNSLKNPDSEFKAQAKKFFENDALKNIKQLIMFLSPDFMRLFRAKMIDESVSTFFLKVLTDTIKYREENNINRKDFMQLLIQLKNKGRLEDDSKTEEEEAKADLDYKEQAISFNELAAQAFVFFIAGYETSSTTLSFCLYELSLNKEVQNLIRKEINEVLNKYNGEITYEALGEMTYMDRVISETLRKYPPLPSLNRVCNLDYKVPGTDLILEVGTKVTIPIIGLQRDEEYYPEPEKFDPERFTEENKKKRPAYTYLPFGEGPRICIGLRFGIMQTKVGLTALLRNYEVSLNSKTVTPLVMDPRSFILSTKGGIWLDVRIVK